MTSYDYASLALLGLWYLPVGLVLARMWGGFMALKHGWVGVVISSTFLPLVFMTPRVEWPAGLLVTALLLVQFSLGHEYTRPLKVLWRYGWPTLALVALTLFWPALIVGPAAALVVWRLKWKQVPWWGHFNGSWFVDGWASYFELAARGLSVLTFAGALLWGRAWWYPFVESLVLSWLR